MKVAAPARACEPIVQGTRDEAGGQRGEQAEQRERHRRGDRGRVERGAARCRDGDPLRTVPAPLLRRRYRLRRDGQGQAAHQHERLEHQVRHLQRRARVLGQQPGDEWSQAKSAQAGRCRHHLRAGPRRPGPGRGVQFAQVRGGGGAEHADADARDDPADDQAGDRRPADKQQASRHVDTDRDEQYPPSPEPVRHMADQEQAHGHAQRVDREDDRDQHRAEVIPRLVQDVQRRWHGGEGHRDGEHVAGQPEPDPVPSAGSRGSRPRGRPHLRPLVPDFPCRRRGHVNLPDRNCPSSRFGVLGHLRQRSFPLTSICI